MINIKQNILKYKVFITVDLIVFFIIAFLGFFIFSSENKKLPATKISLENCYRTKQVCKFKTDEFKIKILLDKNIYYLKKFNVDVWLDRKKDAHVKAVTFNFRMTNMNMGFNHFKLKQKNNSQQWHGTALLPICVTGRADWVSELNIITQENHYIFSFPVSVKKVSH